MTVPVDERLTDEIQAILDGWRIKALNTMLLAMCIVALPAVITPLVIAVRTGAWGVWAAIYIVGYLLVVLLALFRTWDFRVRGWLFLLMGYAVAMASFFRAGLPASGRIYLIFLPMVALILLDLRSSYVALGISLTLYAALIGLVHQGVLAETVFLQENPLDTAFWIDAGAALVMFLLAQMILTDRFYRFQLQTLTAERSAQAQLQEYSRSLEEKVAQRTVELSEANAKLQRRAHELEISNAELDAFAHTVAHDLKNPLSVVIGTSSMLEARQEKMSPEVRAERLRAITKMGYKMTNIVEALLLLASVRKRRLEEASRAPLAMAEIVAEALARLEDQIAETGATIEIERPAAWPQVLGYAPWIEEVWVNYVSNALKYGGRPAEGAPPRVEIGCDVATTPEERHRFWVRDNGPGLEIAAQEKLFIEFQRLEQVRIEGHGLGLSIVRRIVEKLDGEVGLESTPGAGSRFWFTLPAAQAPRA
ncbi:MAG: sensor histidine kinase [Anaerolineales bacterium]